MFVTRTAAKRLLLLLPLWTTGFLLSPALPAESRAKNVILMIADGSGFNTWNATGMYQGKLGKQPYDGPGWVKYGCSTYPLTRSTKPTGKDLQDRTLVYNPAKAWDSTALSLPDQGTGSQETSPRETSPQENHSKETSSQEAQSQEASPKETSPFLGYRYLKSTPTDSAAAATSMGAGVKTYDNAINWTNLNRSLAGRTIAEMAKKGGKRVGVVTTVPWADATPAALGGAHNVSRKNYAAIANEMLNASHLDVILGAGHPDFDDDGRAPTVKKDYNRVGGLPTWNQLKSGTHPGGWSLVESKADFEALAAGPTPRKVLGIAQVATTLQQKRGKRPAAAPGVPVPKPFSCPFNRHVPTLETMTKAALNCLDDNPDGFFLMIEGGALDWANHCNQPERMIEEQIDFLQAIEAVVHWVEKNSTWDETLLILTADHETGLLWGPKSDKIAFDPIVDNGPGNLPGLKYNSTSHSNSLVPLYARGPGSERFAKLVRGADATAAKKLGISGQYVDNTDIFAAMQAALEPVRPREPAGVSRIRPWCGSEILAGAALPDHRSN